MHLTVPINFGHRQCDRLLVRDLTAASGLDRPSVLWMMFLCWQDYATAREDRRNVPLDPARRAAAGCVFILEEYIGWKNDPGGFIEAAIAAGFFMLTPVAENEADLILTDFFPANAVASNLTNSERGGVIKAYRSSRARAEAAAADQLHLFKQQGGVAVPGGGEHEIKAAVLLVHSICQALKRVPPTDEVWKQTVLAKAVEVVKSVPEPDREAVMKWFVKNRQNQKIPLRLDFILDGFRDFLPEAVQAFGR